MMGHVADALAFELLIRHVLGDAKQILGLLLVVADDDHPGAQKAQAVMRGVDRLFLDDLDVPRLQHFPVARHETVGFLLGKYVVVDAADDGLAFDAEKFLAGVIEQHEAEVACVLDEDHGGNVLDHRFEELFRAKQRAQCLAGLGCSLSRSRRRHATGPAHGLSASLHRLPLRPRPP